MKRKRSRPPARHKPDALDLADQALDHCRNIRTLVNLMRAADSPAGNVPLTPGTVGNTAFLIGEQTARLQELVHHLHERLAKPSAR